MTATGYVLVHKCIDHGIVCHVTDDLPPELLTEPEIEAVIQQYHLQLARYENMARWVEGRLRRLLRSATVRHHIEARAKDPEDLRGKLRRKKRDPRYKYRELTKNINGIVTDLAGCRVTVHDPADVDQVFRIVTSGFQSPAVNGAIERHDKTEGYRATHVLVISDSEDLDKFSIKGAFCEIQICSLAQHVFNEIEHNIKYKDQGCAPTQGELQKVEQVRLLARALEGAVQEVLAARSASVNRRTTPLRNAEDLKYALEQALNRPLHGDFLGMHRLLDAVVRPFSLVVMETVGSIGALLESGRQRAEHSKITDGDDVIYLVLGLMKDYGIEFKELARQWTGPTTALTRIILDSEVGDAQAATL